MAFPLERWRVVIDHPDPGRVTPSHLHALVSRWLDDDHWRGHKPYSLVPVHELTDGRAAFEVGALAPLVGQRLHEGWRGLRQRGGRLGGMRFAAPDEPELVAFAAWEELWEGAPAARVVRVRFETPTTFRSRRVSLPLPLPSSAVHSWNRRWQHFAPSVLATEVDLNAARHAVAIDELDGRTVRVDTPGRPLAGFVGQIGYRNHEAGETGHSVGRRLACLAATAEFAGTGSATTAGLGVTTLVDVHRIAGGARSLRDGRAALDMGRESG